MLHLSLTLIAGVSLALLFLAHGTIHWLVTRQPKPLHGILPVSILKPLKGLDDELEANLESFCCQSHPDYEILFGAADPSDPALTIARRVAAAHPWLPIRILAGEHRTGLNPKVRVLRALLRHARHEVILISDSNVRVDRDYLAATAAELEEPTVGLVSNPILGSGHRTLGAALENMQLNSSVMFGLVLTNLVGRYACVLGKSMMLRQSALLRIGGLARFADVLAEDFLIGRAMRESGFRVTMCPSAIQTINKTWTLEKTWKRHLRWSQIRRSLGAPGHCLELLLLPHLWLLGAVVAYAVSSPIADSVVLTASGIAFVSSCLSEAIATSRWSHHGNRFMTLLGFAALRQFGQGWLWLLAWTRSGVEWRGNRLRLGKGSKLIGQPGSMTNSPQTLERQPA